MAGCKIRNNSQMTNNLLTSLNEGEKIFKSNSMVISLVNIGAFANSKAKIVCSILIKK